MTEPTGHVDTFARDRLPARDTWPVLLRDPNPPRLNASVELLDGTIERVGADLPAFIAADGTWTYGDLRTDVQRCAAVLADAGVVPGTRVLLRAPNNGWLVIAWLATLRLGAVVVTTAPLLRAMELDPIVEISQPSLAIVDHRYTEEWDKVQGFTGTTITVGSGSPESLESRAAASTPRLE